MVTQLKAIVGRARCTVVTIGRIVLSWIKRPNNTAMLERIIIA